MNLVLTPAIRSGKFISEIVVPLVILGANQANTGRTGVKVAITILTVRMDSTV